MNTDALPAPLAQLVLGFIREAGVDFSDAAAVESECETWSDRLAVALHESPIEVDDDGDVMVEADTWTPLMWATEDDVPADLAGDELAIGHVICVVEWDGAEYAIDLTAAQFPMWDGPRCWAV